MKGNDSMAVVDEMVGSEEEDGGSSSRQHFSPCHSKAAFSSVFAALVACFMLYTTQLPAFLVSMNESEDLNENNRRLCVDNSILSSISEQFRALPNDISGPAPRRCENTTRCESVSEYLLSRRNGNRHFVLKLVCLVFQGEDGLCWVPLHPEDSLSILESSVYTAPAAKFFTYVHRVMPSDTNGAAVLNLGDSGEILTEEEMSVLIRLKTPFLGHAMYKSTNRNTFLFIPDYKYMDTHAHRIGVRRVTRAGLPFEERASGVFWRGTTTGASAEDCKGFENAACSLSHPCMTKARVSLVLLARKLPKADLKLSGLIDCCSGCTSFLRDLGVFTGFVPDVEWVKFRAILDIDGNTNAWGLYWRLLSGSVVVRVEGDWIGYYSSQLKPWVHFVPVNKDLSDLRDRVKLVASERPEDVAKLKAIAETGAMKARELGYEEEISRVARGLLKIWESNCRSSNETDK